MKHFFLLAAAAVSTPAFAQEAPAPQTAEAAPAAETAPTPDAERMAAAKAVVEHLFPAGSYARVMNETLEKVVRAAVAKERDRQLSEIAVMGWLTDEQFQQLSDENIEAMIAIIDPASNKRMNAVRQAMAAELANAMSQIEPDIREGLILTYAQRFTPEQLIEINNFFSTPAGSQYAHESLPIFMAPEVMGQMTSKISKVGDQLPAMFEAVSMAVAGMPKHKFYAKLTKAERKRMAALMGLSEAELARRNKPLK